MLTTDDVVKRAIAEISQTSHLVLETVDVQTALIAGSRAIGTCQGMLVGLLLGLHEPEKARQVALQLSESLAKGSGDLCGESTEIAASIHVKEMSDAL